MFTHSRFIRKNFRAVLATAGFLGCFAVPVMAQTPVTQNSRARLPISPKPAVLTPRPLDTAGGSPDPAFNPNNVFPQAPRNPTATQTTASSTAGFAATRTIAPNTTTGISFGGSVASSSGVAGFSATRTGVLSFSGRR